MNDNDNSGFYIPVLTVLTLMSVLLIARFCYELPSDWKSYVCSGDNCTLQSWLSALSGWVGGAIAFAALWPVWHQLREMRRQTAFVVGDELPSVEIWTNNNLAVYRFRIVNWNRRAFLIYQVRWTRAPNFPAESQLRVDTETEERTGVLERIAEMGPNGQLKAWAVVEGWENRSLKPEAKRFWQLATAEPTALVFDANEDMSAELEIVGQFAGQGHRPIVLKARAHTLIDLTPSRGGPGLYRALENGFV